MIHLEKGIAFRKELIDRIDANLSPAEEFNYFNSSE